MTRGPVDRCRRMGIKTVTLWVGFVATVFVANWLTNSYGFVPVGFGLSATAGTYAAGMSFGLRDALHEVTGRWVVVTAIVAGAGVSAVVSPSLALASGVAFLISESADLAVYEPLRQRRWVAAVVLSNLVGASLDTVIFLHLAGFPIRAAFTGQMVGKMVMVLPALVVVALVRRSR